MPKSYSGDLRERVIEEVEAGASRREAAERFGISASSAARSARSYTAPNRPCSRSVSRPKQRDATPAPYMAILSLPSGPRRCPVGTACECHWQRVGADVGHLWQTKNVYAKQRPEAGG
jgi:hypothetical protein